RRSRGANSTRRVPVRQYSTRRAHDGLRPRRVLVKLWINGAGADYTHEQFPVSRSLTLAEETSVAENSAVWLSLWSQCARTLEADLSEQQFNTWIRPLQPVADGALVRLLAPNRFVVDWVKGHCLGKIRSWWSAHGSNGSEVVVEVGTRAPVRR